MSLGRRHDPVRHCGERTSEIENEQFLCHICRDRIDLDAIGRFRGGGIGFFCAWGEFETEARANDYGWLFRLIRPNKSSNLIMDFSFNWPGKRWCYLASSVT